MKINLLAFLLNLVRKFRPIHLHWANIDLAAGAMLSQLAINRLPTGKTSLSLPVTIVLGLSVFVLSSVNRLLDNRKPAKTEMKRFLPNQNNRITFLEVIAGALVIGIFLAFYMPSGIWKLVLAGLIFGGFCIWLLSLLPEKSGLHMLRAPVSAVLLTIGVLGSIYYLSDDVVKEIKYATILFLLVAFQNFLLSSYYQSVDYPNVANLSGILQAQLSQRILHLITFFVMAGGVYICLHTDFRYTQRLTVIMMLMSVLQSVMIQKTKFLQGNKYKGMFVVLVLSIPLLIL